jgi:hypothetical protein
VNRLIMNLAESRREASDEEIQRIREHVAAVGFESGHHTKAGPRIAGLVWDGKRIQSSDRMNNGVVHYLRHVIARQEWSSDTSFDEYVTCLRTTVIDSSGGILLHRLHDVWHLTFVSAADRHRGPAGGAWIAVGYGVNYGYWITGYQPKLGLHRFVTDTAKGERWLCRPRTQIE